MAADPCLGSCRAACVDRSHGFAPNAIAVAIIISVGECIGKCDGECDGEWLGVCDPDAE